MKQALIVTAALVVLGVLMLRTLQGEAAYECEACMDFGGRSHCASVAGPDRQEAAARAVSLACGILTTGVTQTLACERQPATSLSCQER